MTRRVKTHIRLGIRTVSPSDQSPCCPHEETLGPYLPIAKELLSWADLYISIYKADIYISNLNLNRHRKNKYPHFKERYL